MRIISKQHDYIDSIQAHGLDEKVVYIRKSEEINFTKKYQSDKFKKVRELLVSHNDIDVKIIGFCGKIYPLIDHKYEKQKLASYDVEHHILWNSDDVMNLYESKKLKKSLIRFLEKTKNKQYYFSNKFNKELTDKMFNELTGSECCEWIFREYNIPVFVLKIDKYRKTCILEKNPTLHDLSFGKKFDAYTAFQEISMYISGVLGIGNNDMVTISDKDKRDKKGFNEMSFKTRKGTKKPRNPK